MEMIENITIRKDIVFLLIIDTLNSRIDFTDPRIDGT